MPTNKQPEISELEKTKQAEKAWRDSENKFRDLLENANDLIQSVNPEGKFDFVNRKWLKVLEYTAEEVHELKLTDILRPDQVSHCLAEFKKVAAGETLTSVEAVFISKTGKEIYVEGNVSPRMENGRFLSTRAIFRDVTERKQAEAKIKFLLETTQQANDQLKKMDETKDEFLSMTTHDLKAPLVPIETYADLLRKGQAGALSEKQRQYAERIKEASVKMRGLIDDILDYTRIEFGRVKLSPEVFSLNGLVQECVEEVLPTANHKQIKLDLNPDKTNLLVKADKNMIGRVVVNLVSNAVKYTPEKGRIAVSLYQEKDQVVCSVQDTGIGILKEHLAKVFDKFYMVTAARAREERSLGLGLHIAKSFIEAHGGQVRAESQGKDRGAKFSFTLPLA